LVENLDLLYVSQDTVEMLTLKQLLICTRKKTKLRYYCVHNHKESHNCVKSVVWYVDIRYFNKSKITICIGETGANCHIGKCEVNIITKSS